MVDDKENSIIQNSLMRGKQQPSITSSINKRVTVIQKEESRNSKPVRELESDSENDDQ